MGDKYDMAERSSPCDIESKYVPISIAKAFATFEEGAESLLRILNGVGVDIDGITANGVGRVGNIKGMLASVLTDAAYGGSLGDATVTARANHVEVEIGGRVRFGWDKVGVGETSSVFQFFASLSEEAGPAASKALWTLPHSSTDRMGARLRGIEARLR